MIRKIVAPVDGSAASEHIIPHIAGLCRAVDAGVTLLHVAGPGPQAGRRGRDYLESLRRRCRPLLTGAKTVLRIGEPAVEILNYGVEQRADLIAITTRGASAVRRVLFGATAIELMRSSPIPLLVIRPEFPVRRLERILAAVDSSRNSREVLGRVRDLARGGDSDVVLVHALPGGESRERASASLELLAGDLRGDGVRVEPVLASGDPARAIVQSALDHRADLIALGTHGRRATDRHFFGSVAESVLLASRVPLLLQRSVRVPRSTGKVAHGARA